MKQKKKTHKATVKRFAVTKNKKVLHQPQGDNTHLKANKNRLQKARKKKQGELKNRKEVKNILRFI